jgi:hypothetical protein
MKTQVIAALLLSSLIAAPAFADGNANLGNDVQSWEGPSVLTRAQVRQQLIASEQAHQYANSDDNLNYPVLNNSGPSKTRAEVKAELAQAQADGQLNAYDNTTYPAEPALASAPAKATRTAVAQGNGLPARENP